MMSFFIINIERGIMALSQNNWNQTKVKIKAMFGKLSDSEIEGLKNHMDQLPRRVQRVYNYGILETAQRCKALNDSLKSN